MAKHVMIVLQNPWKKELMLQHNLYLRISLCGAFESQAVSHYYSNLCALEILS